LHSLSHKKFFLLAVEKRDKRVNGMFSYIIKVNARNSYSIFTLEMFI